MVKVSVVIPVYNVGEFLGECLDSIVNQSLRDIEIICVNDGSTDDSLSILEGYAEKDSRFTVVSQENGGHAVATNKGMSMASGKYLYLMDSDDILEFSALEDTYNLAEEKNADMVLFKSINYDNDENRYYKSELYSMDKVADFIGDSVVNYEDLGDLIFEIPVTPWSKLYNNSFIKKINVKFPEGLVFDDNVFFWDVLFNAERIVFLNQYLFIRRWYNYSSTTSGDLRFMDSIEISNLIIDRFKKYGVFNQYKKRLYNLKISITNWRLSKIKKEYKQQYFERLREDHKKIVSEGLYDDYMGVLEHRNRNVLDSSLKSETYTRFLINLNHINYCENVGYDLSIFEESGDIKNVVISIENELLRLLEKNNKLMEENNNLKSHIDDLEK